ncbi:pentatricopeptide repeat-containing protein 1, mitochondrial [Augochlora pura]
MFSLKINSVLKLGTLIGYLGNNFHYIKYINYVYCTNARSKCYSLHINKSDKKNELEETRRNLLHQSESNRSFCTATPKDANVFGDLAYEKYERVEMDEAEKEEEEFTENDAKVPKWRKYSHGQYCNLIKSHISDGNLDLALSVLDLVKENRDKPTTHMYNLLIYGYAQKGLLQMCFKLYNRLKKHGLNPSEAVYNNLLNACALSKDTNKALEYLQQLRENFYQKNVVLNATHYATIVKAYAWHKKVDIAFELADEARDKNLVSDDLYVALFHGAISDEQNGLKYALALWHQMNKYRIKKTIIHYNLLFRAIRDTKFGELKVNDFLIPDTPDSQIVLKPAGRPDLLASPPVLSYPLLSLIENKFKNESKDPINTEISPDNESIMSQNLNEILMSNKLILFGGLETLLTRMKSDKVIPDAKTLTLIMELLPDSIAVEEKFMEYINNNRLEVDISFYNMLIKKRSFRRQYKAAKDVLSEAQRRHLSPNIITFGVLALACPTLQYGKELLEQMDMLGFQANGVILGTLIRAACFRKDFRYIQFLLNYSLENNIKLTNYVYQVLTNFDRLVLEEIKDHNKSYTRSELRKLSNDYNSYKLFYNAWKEKMEKDDIVKMSKEKYKA